MLYVLNRENSLKSAETLPARSSKTLLTGTEELYAFGSKSDRFDKVIYGNSLSGVPNKSFGLAFVEQFVITTDISLMKIAQVVNGGVIFPYTLPWSLEKFVDNVELAKETLRREEKIKEERNRLKELHKERMAAYKEEKKKIKEQNKKLKEEYEKALKEAPESVKAFIQEPEYIPEPKKPSEPIMPEYPKGYSLNVDRQDKSFGWKLLSRFEFFQVEGSGWGYLRRRPELLKFSAQTAIDVAKIGKMTKEEFFEEISRLDVDTPKVAEIKQSFIDS